jgi:helicase MOV-10
VVDEAGHSWEVETLNTIATQQVGTLLILAGDPKQLGPVTHSDLGKENGLSKSFLERLLERPGYVRNVEKFPATCGYDSNCVTKLITCYRCHPDIIRIPNSLYYEGDLVDGTGMEARMLEQWSGLVTPKFPVIFDNVKGENEQEGSSPSWFNQAEALQVLEYTKQLLALPSIKPEDIGIIAPYQKQVKKIRSLLEKTGVGKSQIMVGSCEQFQGQERKIIIISTVRSEEGLLGLDSKFNLGFVADSKRMNVAMTRAKALLIIVGSGRVLSKNNNWKRFIDYCIEKGGFRGDSLDDNNQAAEPDGSGGGGGVSVSVSGGEATDGELKEMLSKLSISEPDNANCCVS